MQQPLTIRMMSTILFERSTCAWGIACDVWYRVITSDVSMRVAVTSRAFLTYTK